MRLRPPACLFVLALTVATDAAAQEFFYPPKDSGLFRTAAVYYENFFQAPNGRETRDVVATLLEVRLEETAGARERSKAYVHVEYVQFRTLGASPGLIVGFKRKGRNSFDVGTAFKWNRPRSDVGDDPELGNLYEGNAMYAYRIVSGLQVLALSEYRVEFLQDQSTPDTRYREFGGAVAYRAFGDRLSAEAGLLRGARRASNANVNYTQQSPYVSVRTTTVPRLSVSMRYKEPRREYMVADPASKNFGRQDRRRSTSGSVDVTIGKHVLWNVSGGLDRGESTRRNRAFRARSLSTGITLTY